MDAPTWLSHKPAITIADYDTQDGIHQTDPSKEWVSDAKALSIGKAQYDANHFSAKVFRYTGSGWSPQSEELPLHRVLDLAILLVAAMKRIPGAPGSLSSMNETVVSADGFGDLQRYLIDPKNALHLQPRLAELKRLLSL